MNKIDWMGKGFVGNKDDKVREMILTPLLNPMICLLKEASDFFDRHQ